MISAYSQTNCSTFLGFHFVLRSSSSDSQAPMTQSGDGGLSFPMAERSLSPEPLAFERASAEPCHLGGGAGFIYEDKSVAFAIEPRLAVPPGFTCRLYFGAILFRRSSTFLYRNPCRNCQRDSDQGSISTPSSAISAACSGMVMSGYSAIRRSRRARCGSSLE